MANHDCHSPAQPDRGASLGTIIRHEALGPRSRFFKFRVSRPNGNVVWLHEREAQTIDAEAVFKFWENVGSRERWAISNDNPPPCKILSLRVHLHLTAGLPISYNVQLLGQRRAVVYRESALPICLVTKYWSSVKAHTGMTKDRFLLERLPALVERRLELASLSQSPVQRLAPCLPSVVNSFISDLTAPVESRELGEVGVSMPVVKADWEGIGRSVDEQPEQKR
ncbi:hypothetical protein CGLO_02618 [Colletotrichum gloeosporioides Cg-14]|uniref:Uncharacterized protein n=1 Tax=Colletotrichum gloeosporioides (strain Cg-14) TaxID=1237896 RepID=T0KNG1_COLGC|nr:hypothetical protein CGLO_02618 [Colletotrichum gloeosporioides Cg-14]